MDSFFILVLISSVRISHVFFGFVLFCFKFKFLELASCVLFEVKISGTPPLNWQFTSRPKHNDDISLLMYQYLISV
jgi:hypothetical protein